MFTAAICTAFNGAGGIAGSYIVRSSEAPRYPTAVWTSIGYVSMWLGVTSLLTGCDSSHILMIGIVAVFSIYFTIANKAQKQGTKIIERTVSVHWCVVFAGKFHQLMLEIGGFPVYDLENAGRKGNCSKFKCRCAQPQAAGYGPLDRTSGVVPSCSESLCKKSFSNTKLSGNMCGKRSSSVCGHAIMNTLKCQLYAAGRRQ